MANKPVMAIAVAKLAFFALVLDDVNSETTAQAAMLAFQTNL